MPSILIILLTPTKIVAPADQINAYQEFFRAHQNYWHPAELLRRPDQRWSKHFFEATKTTEIHQICCVYQSHSFMREGYKKALHLHFIFVIAIAFCTLHLLTLLFCIAPLIFVKLTHTFPCVVEA